jgi:hypothetical protein
VRATRVWKQLVGVDDRTVIEDVEFEDDDGVVVVYVRPRRPRKRRCGRCEQPAPGFDNGEGRRRWRGLDLGMVKVVLEADAPRVHCVDAGRMGDGGADHRPGGRLPDKSNCGWCFTKTSPSKRRAPEARDHRQALSGRVLGSVRCGQVHRGAARSCRGRCGAARRHRATRACRCGSAQPRPRARGCGVAGRGRRAAGGGCRGS